MNDAYKGQDLTECFCSSSSGKCNLRGKLCFLLHLPKQNVDASDGYMASGVVILTFTLKSLEQQLADAVGSTQMGSI